MNWRNGIIYGVFGLLLTAVSVQAAENLTNADDLKKVDGITVEYDYEEQLYDLNQKGVELFQANKFAEAIDVFKEALKIVPDDKTVKNNLLAAYSYIAIEHMNKEEYKDAVGYFEEALRLSPDDVNIKRNLAFIYLNMASKQYDEDNTKVDETITLLTKALTFDPGNETIKRQLGMFLYNKAMDFYSDHEYKKAKEYLRESLKYYPDQAYTYEVLGDIGFYEHELADAKQFWQKAGELEPSSRIQEKLNKVNRDITADKELVDYPSQQFIIKYVPGFDLYTGYEIREILREAYRQVGHDFNFYPKYKIVALLYSKELFQNFVDGYWVTAAYDGKIRLPQEENNVPEERLKALAWHEYTHAIIHYLSGNKAPQWLQEGLAMYEENRMVPINMALIKKKVREGYEFTLEKDLSGSPPTLGYEQLRLYYLESYTLVDYLIKRYRLYKIKELLGLMKEGDDFETAMKKSLFLSPDRLNAKWNEYVYENYT